MTDHEHSDEDDLDHNEHGDHGASEGRVTSPMQEFGTSQVGLGLVVLLVGLVLTFGLAFGLVGI